MKYFVLFFLHTNIILHAYRNPFEFNTQQLRCIAIGSLQQNDQNIAVLEDATKIMIAQEGDSCGAVKIIKITNSEVQLSDNQGNVFFLSIKK